MIVGDGDLWQVTGIALAHAADALSFSWLLIHFHNLAFLLPIPNTTFFQQVQYLSIYQWLPRNRMVVSFPFTWRNDFL